jgi:divalent metal cation (Fe/Co/Zn/Cd) transporter
MTVEAGVAVAAALASRSVALFGFGLDSLIELASATTILWLYTGGRDGTEAAERWAQRTIAVLLAVLAVYLAFDAITTLAGGARPQTSWPGVVVTAGAIIIMPVLARGKRTVAGQLGSSATAGDAAQSWLCAVIATAALVSMLANSLLGSWWLDPGAGLLIAALAAYEARETWKGDACAACAPLGYGNTDMEHGCG